MLRSTPSLPFQVLGKPDTTVHAVDDIVSVRLSSTTASAPSKDSLAVSADPKGQVASSSLWPASLAPPGGQPCVVYCWRLVSHPSPASFSGGGQGARCAGRRASAGAHAAHIPPTLAQHSVGADGGIPPRCAGCDDLHNLLLGGRDMLRFGTRRPRRPARSTHQHDGLPRNGVLPFCRHLL